MKALKYIFQFVFILLLVSSCSKDYAETPLIAPEYTGAPANITIAQLKEEFKDVKHKESKEITKDYILKGYVTANDRSGNIFKQIYVQDDNGHAINISIDQNNLYSTFYVGQEIYFNLKGLHMVNYGNQFQIGLAGGSNRIPWEIFLNHYALNDFAKPNKAKITNSAIGNLRDDQGGTLVKFDNVTFENGGEGFFIDPKQGTNATEQFFTDKDGNKLLVRTSSYATLLKGIALPKGKGSITGVLGRYYETWQLMIRDKDDIGIFTEDGGTVTPEPIVKIFSETFDKVQGVADRPKIGMAIGLDNGAPVTYTDASGMVDVRQTGSLNPHIWFPSAKDVTLVIDGIQGVTNTNKHILTYDIAANLSTTVTSAELNVIQIKVNGALLAIPSKIITVGNQMNKITAEVPAAATYKIEIISSMATNIAGYRIDNIKIEEEKGTGLVPTP